MSKQKLTPWFPPEVKPVRVGMYRVKSIAGNSFPARWNGRCWMQADWDEPFVIQRREWRGLASQPKDSAPRG